MRGNCLNFCQNPGKIGEADAEECSNQKDCRGHLVNAARSYGEHTKRQ